MMDGLPYCKDVNIISNELIVEMMHVWNVEMIHELSV